MNERWSRPDPRMVKLNVDASFYSDEGAGATAAIIRDHNGKFLEAKCAYLTHAADATTTEALAMQDGLILANSLGFDNI